MQKQARSWLIKSDKRGGLHNLNRTWKARLEFWKMENEILEKKEKPWRKEYWLLLSTLVALLLAAFGILQILTLKNDHVKKRKSLLNELEDYRNSHFVSKVSASEPGIVVGRPSKGIIEGKDRTFKLTFFQNVDKK